RIKNPAFLHDNVDDQLLARPLPSVIDLHLYIGKKVTIAKHGFLSDQLALPVVFPNLQALQIFYQKVHCDECQITLKQRSRAEIRSDTSNEPDWPGFGACVDATLQCL